VPAATGPSDAPVDLTRDAPAAGQQVGEEADVVAMDRRHELTPVHGEYRTSIIIDPPTGQIPKRQDEEGGGGRGTQGRS
jgi:hypothetical protein